MVSNSVTKTIICGHDGLALDMIASMAEQGLRCPEDVSIVGLSKWMCSRET